MIVVAGICCVVLSFYLIVAFVSWKFDPFSWSFPSDIVNAFDFTTTKKYLTTLPPISAKWSVGGDEIR